MEPFPAVEEEQASATPSPSQQAHQPDRSSTAPSSAIASRLRSASVSFLESNPPTGMWLASGEIASHAPTLAEIHAGCFGVDGWTEEGQLEHRGCKPHEILKRRIARASTFAGCVRATDTPAGQLLQPVQEGEALPRRSTEPARLPSTADSEPEKRSVVGHAQGDSTSEQPAAETDVSGAPEAAPSAPPTEVPDLVGADETGTYLNGYKPPPKRTWLGSIALGLRSYGRFVLTPYGFFVTLYAASIASWGGMLFLLLFNAAPAMCRPSCDDPTSVRFKWIEIDAQVLNALFSLTSFGLAPWRFRDFYYLMAWRAFGSHVALRKLAGIYRTWFRLPGSDKLPETTGPAPVYSSPPPDVENPLPRYTEEELERLRNNPAVPLPPSSIPSAPLTGVRAPPTSSWLIDTVVWMYVLNTLDQGALSGLMWGMPPETRPLPAVGTLVLTGIVSAAIPGLIGYIQGRRIKKIEGVPVEEEPEPDAVERETTDPAEQERLARRRTQSFKRKSRWFRRHYE